MAILFSDLIKQCRERTNTENDTSKTDAELASYLNASLAELYELIIQSNEEYSLKRIVFQMDNLGDGYVLPNDFWKVLRVDRQLDSNNYYTLSRINIRDENLYSPAFNRYFQTVNSYSTEMLSDGYSILRVYPTTNQFGIYKVLYYPAYQDFDLQVDGYVTMGPPGQHWEEYAIVDTILKMCIKDETDISGITLQKGMILNRIKAAAASRDVGQTEPPPKTFPWYERNSRMGWY